jgi:hypothetical protein
MEKKMIDFINVVAKCQATCNYCYNACLEEKDVDMMVQCIKLDRDCADICSTVISFVSASSNFEKEILMLCVDICQACAKECGKHAYEHCKECAEACKACAEICRAYV